MVCINNNMSKFEETLKKHFVLLEFGKSSDTQFAAQGGTGINLGDSPIRPYPGTLDTGDMEQDTDQIKVRPGTKREVAKLAIQVNNGSVRTAMHKLANKEPLSQPEQEIVDKMMFMMKNKKDGKKSSIDPSADKEENLSKTVVSDNVELLNNPNRPKISYAQS
jgi:hypothetical protein